jgi:uncharacterized protein (TIGR03435 family)
LYVQASVPCASGVTGADLKRRIAAILSGGVSDRLTLTRKVIVAGLGISAVALPVLIGVLKTPLVKAQSQLKFEVASIRRSNPDSENSRLGPVPGGDLRANNITAMQLVTFAYNVHDFQISGAPEWMKTERIDILAKPERPEGSTDMASMTDVERGKFIDQLRERTRSLLAERFRFAMHKDTKELPVYELIIAKGGHKLKPATTDERRNQHMVTGRGQISGERSTIEMLRMSLSNVLGRTVVDRTGLTGTYDFRMEWTPDFGTSLPGKLTKPDAPDPASLPGAVSIFTAIQEQLGLKLESKKGPVEVIAIDRVERPSEN